MLRSSVILLSLGSALVFVPDVVSQAAAVSPEQVPDGLSVSDWSTIREAHIAGQYAAQAVEGGYRARNPGQQWHTRFDGLGFTTEPDAGGWTWGLRLSRYGLAGSERDVASPVHVEASGGRVAYDWDDSLTEWFVNDSRGLEHGYTVHSRPASQSMNEAGTTLSFTLAVRGELVADVKANGRGVRFVNAGGLAVLTYTGLTVFDADGRSLPGRLEATPGGLTLTVETRGARYPLTIDPVVQLAYFKASNTDPADYFGLSVAVSGDTVVVGAPREYSAATGVDGDQADNSEPTAGAAYVFVRSGTGWSQQAYLKASNTDGGTCSFCGYDSGDLFGNSVAVSGDTVVVGAPNESSAATGVDGDQSDNSGTFSGAAYVFVRSGTTWSQQAYLKASNTGLGDQFGVSVAMSGDTVVVGARMEDSAATGVNGDQSDDSAINSGAAYVFVRSGTRWSQQAYLKASNTETGDGFGAVEALYASGVTKGFEFSGGHSVAVSGDTIVVGALFEDSAATGVNGDQGDNSATKSGAAYVFVRSGTRWSQQAYLKASNSEARDGFGTSVGVSGSTVVVGARFEDSAATGVDGDQSDNSALESGAAYVFERSGTSWSQQAYLKASNADGGVFPPLLDGDHFGQAVAVSGDAVVIGALREDSMATGVNGDQDDNSAADSGAAYLFVRAGTSWSQQAYLKASNTGNGDNFGVSVAMSGDKVVVGAHVESSDATGVNGNQGDNSAFSAGAAYTFMIPPAECFLVIGDSPGDAMFLEIEHLFKTQVGPTVEDSYAVLLNSIPEFVLPVPLTASRVPLATSGGLGVGASGVARGTSLSGASPEWMSDGQFSLQVLMWNPLAFPGQPEQFTAGLYVNVLPDGQVVATPYGSAEGGLDVWIELDTNAQGQKVIRFPFSLQGL